MRTTKIKEQIMCKFTWENSDITMSGHCSACGKGGIGIDTKGGWLDPELCAKARRAFVITRCTLECARGGS